MPLSSVAKVFSFKKTTFGTYFKGNYGLSTLGDDIYDSGAGADTNFTESPGYILGGEVGVLIRAGYVGFRAGVNIVAPQAMTDMEGKNSAGTVLMTVDSNVTSVLPSIHMEIYPYKTDSTSLAITAGVGSGNTTFVTKYDLTADGETNYGVTDYTEEGRGLSLFSEGGVAFEFHFSRSTTLSVDAGYRYLYVGKFTHQRNVTTIRGTIQKGDVVKVSTGQNLKLNLSGPFAGISFRFYFL